jgi:hypothetical protein
MGQNPYKHLESLLGESMRFVLFLCLLSAQFTVQAGESGRPVDLPVFNSAAMNEAAISSLELLLKLELAPSERVFKWQLEEPRKKGLDHLSQIQNHLYALYIDGTAIQSTKGLSILETKSIVNDLYFNRDQGTVGELNWTEATLEKFAVHLFGVLEASANLRIFELRSVQGDFNIYSGFALLDLETHQVALVMTGLTE